MTNRWRNKPVVIDAFRFMIDEYPEWFKQAVSDGAVRVLGTSCAIETLEGVMTVNIGNWIIRGVKGELYPCKPDIFEATYEPA